MEVCGVFIILMGIKSYRESTYKGAKKVYEKVVELKCTHIISSASWEELVKNKSVTCNACGSIALQLAGCLPKGVRVGHVSTKGKKESSITSIDKAMYNANRLSNCRLIWCNCKYSELPAWLKERGTVYIQWSNCCVNAGNGYIWSCNQGEGYHGGRYTEYLNGVLSKKGYPFGGTIFVAILPDDKWYQHYAVECILGLHGNGKDREEFFGKDYKKVQSFVNDMLKDEDYLYRWLSDYILEMYAENGEARKKLLGKYYDKAQAKVNWVSEQAKLCWKGKVPSGIARAVYYGKDYKIVQRQVNRCRG